LESLESCLVASNGAYVFTTCLFNVTVTKVSSAKSALPNKHYQSLTSPRSYVFTRRTPSTIWSRSG